MKNKKIILIISILSVLVIILGVLFMHFIVLPYFRFIDTHTWATVTAKGEIQSDENGTFEYTQEYLKGDTINVGDVTLQITDIGTMGTVDIKVQSGNLYDSDGKIVKKFTIDLDNRADFQMDNGSVTFSVDSNRYH